MLPWLFVRAVFNIMNADALALGPVGGDQLDGGRLELVEQALRGL